MAWSVAAVAAATGKRKTQIFLTYLAILSEKSGNSLVRIQVDSSTSSFSDSQLETHERRATRYELRVRSLYT